MIQTVDNYNALKSVSVKTTQKDRKDFLAEERYYCLSTAKITKELHLTKEKYCNNTNNSIFSFFNTKDKNSDDDLVISIEKVEDNYRAKTGNYIGKFTYNKIPIDIKSRFSDTFLKRMLNFANDVFLDDVDVSGENINKNETDYSKFIIYYMFVQKLEKAFLLGIPKAYITIRHHDMKLKGKIDINRFIRNDIPFKGKISSVSREQREIQEVIDVLYKAINIIEKDMPSFLKNISQIRTHLKQHKSSKFISKETISKALSSKALQNPIFAPYKKVLEYAKLIIQNGNIEQKENAKNNTYGFLVNVAELYEIYLHKLLQHKFPEWKVIHEDEQKVYSELFYERRMFPDIVMKKDSKVMIFDAKYKRMKFDGRNNFGAGDLDRNDFFQINTYMSYYQNQGNEVIAGGLLYPMEGEFDKANCHSSEWFGNNQTKFIVDGLELLGLNDTNIVDIEQKFIERIESLIIQT